MSLFDVTELYDDAKPDGEVIWRRGIVYECADLLTEKHYLGPIASGSLVFVGSASGEIVAAQVWGHPSARYLPSDGSWLELKRWCLTPAAGKNAGSRMHRYVARWLKLNRPSITTLISYSDPSVGHTGALYRSCNWRHVPTWHRLRPPPTGNGNWGGPTVQSVKDRWVFDLRPDPRRDDVLALPYEWAQDLHDKMVADGRI